MSASSTSICGDSNRKPPSAMAKRSAPYEDSSRLTVTFSTSVSFHPTERLMVSAGIVKWNCTCEISALPKKNFHPTGEETESFGVLSGSKEMATSASCKSKSSNSTTSLVKSISPPFKRNCPIRPSMPTEGINAPV